MRFLKRIIDRILQRLAHHISESLDYERIANETVSKLDKDGIARYVIESLDYEALTAGILGSLDYNVLVNAVADSLNYENIVGAALDSLDYGTLAAKAAESLDYTTLAGSITDSLNYELILGNLGNLLDYEVVAARAAELVDYERIVNQALSNLDYERIVHNSIGFIDKVVQKKLKWVEGLQRDLADPGVPWSTLYDARWALFNSQVLADETVLERFRRKECLPARYGVGIDERCVEFPWLLVNLRDQPETLLDAGSALNYDFILGHPSLRRKTIQILTLSPEDKAFWDRGISYIYGDLRYLPLRDEYYDTVVCLSTLEHVGCDNRFFTGNEAHREHRLDDFIRVMQELRRVLKPGGVLLLTVPFGVYRDFEFQQIFDRNLLTRAIEAFGKTSEVTETFYRYSAGGWDVADGADCAQSQYVEWLSAAWLLGEWPNPIPVEADLAAAARAVACVRLIKA